MRASLLALEESSVVLSGAVFSEGWGEESCSMMLMLEGFAVGGQAVSFNIREFELLGFQLIRAVLH